MRRGAVRVVLPDQHQAVVGHGEQLLRRAAPHDSMGGLQVALQQLLGPPVRYLSHAAVGTIPTSPTGTTTTATSTSTVAGER